MGSDRKENTNARAVLGLIKEATLRNSVRALLSSNGDATDFLKTTAGAVMGGFERPVGGRHESFDEACLRLDIKERDLPKIHNHVVLQCYLAFFLAVALIAASVNLYVSDASLFAVGGCIGGVVACLSTAALSSMQSFRIRVRSLAEDSRWRRSSQEWFPSRVLPAPIDDAGDARLDERMVSAAITRARTFYCVAAGLVALACVGAIGEQSVDLGVRYGLVILSIVFGCVGAKSAIFALQGQQKVDFDIASWILDPSAWVPSHR